MMLIPAMVLGLTNDKLVEHSGIETFQKTIYVNMAISYWNPPKQKCGKIVTYQVLGMSLFRAPFAC